MPRSDFPKHIPMEPDKLERRDARFSRDPLTLLLKNEPDDLDEDEAYWRDLARGVERYLKQH